MNSIQKEKFAITIGRESGSAGRVIGMMVADKLGIRCYDDQLIAVASDISGFSETVISHHEEKTKKSFLYSLVTGSYGADRYGAGTANSMPMEQKVFLAEYNAIKEIYGRENAVFVGRCSDYALQDSPGLISIFVKAKLPDRIAHVMETYVFDEEKAKDFVKSTDKARKNYYEFYTGRKWGGSHYDLIIDRSPVGIEGAANTIVNYVKEKLFFSSEN